MTTHESKSAPPAEMPKHLVQFLLGGQTCVVATCDAHHRPMTTLMTWVVARDPRTLSIAVDTRGRSLANLKANPHVAIEVLGDDLCWGLRGTAVVEKESMTHAPFPCALVAVHLEECRDHGAQGVKFFGPRYHFEPGKEHRSQTEQQVFAELKGTAPTV
ncbi:MAG: pyridoxamine 5'-phosphate oxidase family protein [Deltaproteobacteria bacterium]|nr:pyridoxamine 5'-phosphate oxidase family protein [Deltaproteobacteria bacterium]